MKLKGWQHRALHSEYGVLQKVLGGVTRIFTYARVMLLKTYFTINQAEVKFSDPNDYLLKILLCFSLVVI